MRVEETKKSSEEHQVVREDQIDVAQVIISVEQRTQLRQNIIDGFNLEELRTLCYDLGIDYETLPGEGRAAKARELVAYCERHKCIPELIKLIDSAPAITPAGRPVTQMLKGLFEVIKAIAISILFVLSANALYEVLGKILGWLEILEIIGIGIVIGVIAAVILRWITSPEFKHRRLVIGLTLVIVTVIVSASGSKYNRSPVMVTSWDFEDCTNEGWGVYDEGQGRIVHQSPDIIASTVNARGACSLEVHKLNLPALPKPNAHKQWPAVRYEGDLSNAKVTALVYIPVDAQFRYADAKLFLFDNQWGWRESGALGMGIQLVPGEWVELAWDLRFHKTLLWSLPWKRILGMQIYSDGYTGSVYVDNVTIYK